MVSSLQLFVLPVLTVGENPTRINCGQTTYLADADNGFGQRTRLLAAIQT
jgi:hypothetical protein